MRKICAIIAFCLFVSSPAFSASAGGDIGFTQDWSIQEETFKIRSYEGIYVDKINFKGIVIKLIDSDGDVSYGRLNPETWHDLGIVLYQAFAGQLKTLLPVLESEDEGSDPSSNASPKVLSLNIKISATFEHEDERLLMKWIKGTPSPTTAVPLEIECELVNSQTQKPIVKLSAHSDFTPQNIQKPFSFPDDIAQFEMLSDRWARRVANVLNR